MRVVAVVEPPLRPFQVAVDVLRADLVEGSDDGALEQRPDPLHAVCVNVASYPFVLGMIDRLVTSVLVLDAEAGLEFVRVDRFGFGLDVLGDECVKGPLLDVGNTFLPESPLPLFGRTAPDPIDATSTASVRQFSTPRNA